MTGPRAQMGLLHRVAGQGVLVIAGFGVAQALSLLRNIALGYILSRGDFGIAAAITVTLQLLETLSDVGADRLLLQAPDGEDPAMLAAAHWVLVVRGALTALVLYLAAGPTAQFFHIAAQQPLFEAMALVPLIKGFMHLEQRLHQRRLDNRAFVGVEVGSQAAACLVMPLALWFSPTPAAVITAALVQAVSAAVISHALAAERWRIAIDWQRLTRFLAFGWPIWASAIPLLAVYHADRMVIGRIYGMETLAIYAAAFMVTMIPGLVAARVSHALLLPLLAAVRSDAGAFANRFRVAFEATLVLVVAYSAVFVVAGGVLLSLAFGPNFAGQQAIVSALAVMWAVRMLQAAPGMALMALGDTRPLLVAGLIRAAALPAVVAVGVTGLDLVWIAVAGTAGELASLLATAWALEKRAPGLGRATLRRCILLPVGAGLAAAGHLALGAAPTTPVALLAGLLAGGLASLAAAALLPDLRAMTWRLLSRRAHVWRAAAAG